MRFFHPTIPFQPKSWPFFYGWWMVLMSVFGLLMSAPGQTAGLSPFTDILMEHCSVSRLQLAAAYAVGTTLSGLLIPFAGNLVDRWGARVMMCIGVLLLSLTVWGLSTVDLMAQQVAQLFGSSPTLPALFLLSLGFTLLRFSGQGLMTLCSNLTTGHWFKRRRGLASAIIGSVLSLTMNLMPLCLVFLIEWSDWRMAWRGIGLFHALVVLPLIWLFWRNEPEPCGLFPDGKAPAEEEQQAEGAPEPEWTRAQALRSLAFWVPSLSMAVGGLIITAVTFHLVDLGELIHMEKQEVMTFLVPFGLCTMILSPLAGLLADRCTARPFLLLQLSGLILHLLLMQGFAPGWRFVVPAISLSVGVALMGAISITVYPRFFGRKHLGKISSVQWSAVVIASALGPALYAISREWTGNYHAAMNGLLAVCVILLILATRVRDPNQQI